VETPNEGFRPLSLAVLTVSDTRTQETDRSGAVLCEAAVEAGHEVVEREIVPDDIYRIRAVVSAWIAAPHVHAIVTTGGTGMAARDRTPEALRPLFDMQIEGFGELFRQVSFEEIGTSTLQSRALAGLANRTVIVCLPGSPGACRTAWRRILLPQFDFRHRPCNLAQLVLPD
jgi:molybdenum cofactor biosynthesis protein B